MTGSIGVIAQIPDFRAIADTLRFNMRTFKSGPVKDIGSPLREMTTDDEAIFMDLVRDIYDQFVSLVSERRHMTRDNVIRLADGRFMSGRVAFQAGLIDQLGGLHDAAHKAVALAAEKRAADKGDKLEPSDGGPNKEDEPTLVYPRKPATGLLRLLGEEVGESLGNGLARGLDRAAESAGRKLTEAGAHLELR
jgi:ClpP class serine protease